MVPALASRASAAMLSAMGADTAGDEPGAGGGVAPLVVGIAGAAVTAADPKPGAPACPMPPGFTGAGTMPAVTVSPVLSTTTLRITFCSWRTLPGQG